MFWKFNQSSPQIDTILAKEDLTLDELFEQECLLQELKSQNQKLIEFIIRRDVLDQLVGFIVEEPSDELSETEKYKRANFSCEVLTTDIPRVNESLANEGLLTKMFSFLETEPPLNPLLASFFSRTLSLLICRKADQHWYSYQFTCLNVLDFFKTRNHSLDVLLKHLGTSAIMDLTLKLVTQIEGDEMQKNLNNWLESERFLDNVIDLFDPSVDVDRQYNAAQLLCEIIRKCRETSMNKPDPLLSSLQSAETIQILLKHMLSDDSVSESSINCGITVLLTLLEDPVPESANRRGTYYDENISGETIVNPALPTIVSAIIPSLPKFHNLLTNPPKNNPVKLACGTIEPPLGTVRLSVIKLMSALIATNTREVNELLDTLNIIEVLLDLFFHYTWNNFLHTQVDKCLAFVLNSPVNELTENNPLLKNIFIKCRLIHRILVAWKDNNNEESKEGGKRRGYMGHLTNIANSILNGCEGSLGDFLKQHVDEETWNSWQEYVENSLKPINELHGRVLGGKHPAHGSNEETNTDYTTVPYSNVPFEQNENESDAMESSPFSKQSIKDELINSNEYEDLSFGYGASEMEEDDFANSSFLDSRNQGSDLITEDLDDELSPPEYKAAVEDDDSYSLFLTTSSDKSNSNPWADCANADVNDESWANFDSASFENPFAQNVMVDFPASSDDTMNDQGTKVNGKIIAIAATAEEPTGAVMANHDTPATVPQVDDHPLATVSQVDDHPPSTVSQVDTHPPAMVSQPADTAQPIPPVQLAEKSDLSKGEEEAKFHSGNEVVETQNVDIENVETASVGTKTEIVVEVESLAQLKLESDTKSIIENDNKSLINNVDESTFHDTEFVDNCRLLADQGMLTKASDPSKSDYDPATVETNERTSEVPREVQKSVEVEAAPNPA